VSLDRGFADEAQQDDSDELPAYSEECYVPIETCAAVTLQVADMEDQSQQEAMSSSSSGGLPTGERPDGSSDHPAALCAGEFHIEKRGTKKKRSIRFFVLHEDRLAYYRSRSAFHQRKEPAGMLVTSDIEDVEVNETGFFIRMRSGVEFTLEATDQGGIADVSAVLEDWHDALATVFGGEADGRAAWLGGSPKHEAAQKKEISMPSPGEPLRKPCKEERPLHSGNLLVTFEQAPPQTLRVVFFAGRVQCTDAAGERSILGADGVRQVRVRDDGFCLVLDHGSVEFVMLDGEDLEVWLSALRSLLDCNEEADDEQQQQHQDEEEEEEEEEQEQERRRVTEKEREEKERTRRRSSELASGLRLPQAEIEQELPSASTSYSLSGASLCPPAITAGDAPSQIGGQHQQQQQQQQQRKPRQMRPPEHLLQQQLQLQQATTAATQAAPPPSATAATAVTAVTTAPRPVAKEACMQQQQQQQQQQPDMHWTCLATESSEAEWNGGTSISRMSLHSGGSLGDCSQRENNNINININNNHNQSNPRNSYNCNSSFSDSNRTCDSTIIKEDDELLCCQDVATASPSDQCDDTVLSVDIRKRLDFPDEDSTVKLSPPEIARGKVGCNHNASGNRMGIGSLTVSRAQQPSEARGALADFGAGAPTVAAPVQSSLSRLRAIPTPSSNQQAEEKTFPASAHHASSSSSSSSKQPILLEGFLKVSQDGKLSLQYCRLFRDRIDFWAKQGSATKGAKPEGSVNLNDFYGLETIGTGFLLKHRSGHKTGINVGDSSHLKEWCNALLSLLTPLEATAPAAAGVCTATPAEPRRGSSCSRRPSLDNASLPPSRIPTPRRRSSSATTTSSHRSSVANRHDNSNTINNNNNHIIPHSTGSNIPSARTSTATIATATAAAAGASALRGPRSSSAVGQRSSSLGALRSAQPAASGGQAPLRSTLSARSAAAGAAAAPTPVVSSQAPRRASGRRL